MDLSEPTCIVMEASDQDLTIIKNNPTNGDELDVTQPEPPQHEPAPPEPETPPQAPPSKTMLSYFSKLPSKAVVVEEANPRKLAPAFNRQHVEKFQKTRQAQFDAELYNLNNNNNTETNTHANSDIHSNGHTNELTNSTNGHSVGPNGDNYAPDNKRMRCTDNNSTSVTANKKNYLQRVKSMQHKPFKLQGKTRGPLRARLLQFHEDVRPPYYGTWQRKSKLVCGRRPFAQDEDVFDYEVDSEAEWDLGGPGESLKGDDSEDDEELDDYEIDMKTFVPHGYVSDDEMEVHSDREETASANQSIEEFCDVQDDSNVSVLIVGEKLAKGVVTNGIPSKQNQLPQQLQTQLKQTAKPESDHHPAQTGAPPLPLQPSKQKQEIKAISLGLFFEDAQPMILSQSKLQFLRAFQGCSCK